MKKQLIFALAILLLAATGCKEKPKDSQPVAPQAGMATPQMPANTNPGGDPHAGMKTQEIPAGTGHKGKVVSTMDAAGYTYIEAEEKGQKIWVAVMKTKVKIGDLVEFPDSPPMINFRSKTLNRTFDKIIFASALRVNGK